ncbi:MAG: hypothetical protein HY319_31730 [Armatimonadetes bacterium]|nr:hypothetical protein [Armatimonadota bacterium]
MRDEEAQRARVALEAHRAFFEVLPRQQLTRFAEQDLANRGLTGRAAKTRSDAGLSSRVDVELAQTGEAEARVLSLEAQNALARARGELDRAGAGGHDRLPAGSASRDHRLVPCYSQDNVDRQRGPGVFERSIRALQLLNGLGYGLAHAARTGPGFGVSTGPVRVELDRVMDYVQSRIDAIGVHDRPENFQEAGAEVIFGAPRFRDPGSLEVNGSVVSFRS